MNKLALLMFVLVVLGGCVAQNTSHNEKVLLRQPTNEHELASECDWIRHDIARLQREIASLCTGSKSTLAFEEKARKNIKFLERRAASIGCNTVIQK